MRFSVAWSARRSSSHAEVDRRPARASKNHIRSYGPRGRPDAAGGQGGRILPHHIRMAPCSVEPTESTAPGASLANQARGTSMNKSVWGVFVIAGLLIGVSSAPLFGQMKEKSLYDRLGKKKAITAVVDEVVSPVTGDARVNKTFPATAGEAARLKKVKGKLPHQISEGGGGPRHE